MSMNVCPDDIFWIAEPFATKFGMEMHHYEPDCLPNRSICCLQGRSEDHITNTLLSNIFSELLILLQLNLVWWYIIIRWIVLWKDWIALLWSRSRSYERFKIPMAVHLDDISSTVEPFVTKLGMVIHHYEPDCLSKRFVCCLQDQGHN